jgi:berberine-like enzyme
MASLPGHLESMKMRPRRRADVGLRTGAAEEPVEKRDVGASGTPNCRLRARISDSVIGGFLLAATLFSVQSPCLGKDKWDPENFFRVNQNIKPSRETGVAAPG